MDIQATSELNDAIAQLRRDPGSAVRVRLEGLEVEIRAVQEHESTRCTAAEVFASLGPWAGESGDEPGNMLVKPGRRSGNRRVGEL